MIAAEEGTLLAACSAALRAASPPLAESGTIRLHTLFSRPRPVRSLYPLAHVDIVSDAEPVSTWLEHVVVTAAWKPAATGSERLNYALELYVYTLPAQRAALVYVSKLDTTGYGPASVPARVRAHLPAPQKHAPSLTAVLTAGALEYFASRTHWTASPTPVDHVSTHVLARAQAAYLFPTSETQGRKHVLSDTTLIRWWRAVLSDVVYRRRIAVPKERVDAYYVIPGYSRLDSHPLVPLVAPMANKNMPEDRDGRAAMAQWVYGHPYTRRGAQTDDLPPLPLHAHVNETRFTSMPKCPALQRRTIATLVPVFPDDPKGRFVDELCSLAHEPGKLIHIDAPGKRTTVEREVLSECTMLERTSPDGFWERLGFRQECNSGSAVGVFFVGTSALDIPSSAASATEGTVRKDGSDAEKKDVPATIPCDVPATSLGDATVKYRRETPAAQPYALPHPVLDDLLLKHVLQDACTWSEPTEAEALTRRLFEAVDRAQRRKSGAHDQSGELAGYGRMWGYVGLEQTPAQMITTAEAAAAHTTPAVREANAPNVLSVKRKKRS